MTSGKVEGSGTMRMWGTLHRAFRTAAGLSTEDVAKFVGYSVSLVVNIERGARMPSVSYIPKADEITGANGVLIEAAKHLSRDRHPAWFAEYVTEEERALSLWTYSTHLLHGLIQTEEYARAVFTAHHPPLEEEEIENRLNARMSRQGLLVRKEPSCTLTFVAEEWALRRPLGDQTAMKRQLEHLHQLSDRRNVTIQVMPMCYGFHAGLTGDMSLLETPERRYLGYVESNGMGRLLHDPDVVSMMQERYSMIRSQALNPRESADLIKRLAGEI